MARNSSNMTTYHIQIVSSGENRILRLDDDGERQLLSGPNTKLSGWLDDLYDDGEYKHCSSKLAVIDTEDLLPNRKITNNSQVWRQHSSSNLH